MDSDEWQIIHPDEYNDWINQRDPNAHNYIVMGDKSKAPESCIFKNYSLGVGSNRDPWCYKSSYNLLEDRIKHLISTYNSELNRFRESSFTSIPASWLITDPSQIK